MERLDSGLLRLAVAEIPSDPAVGLVHDAVRDLARAGLEGEGLPAIPVLATLVRRMRRVAERIDANAAVLAVISVLDDDGVRRGARAYVARLARHARAPGALADLGLLPANGAAAELRERMVARILPSHRPPNDLIEVLRASFERADASWIGAADDATLSRLLEALRPDDGLGRATWRLSVLRAIELLSHRLAAAGEDPSLRAFDPTAIDFESPFLAQSALAMRCCASLRAPLTGEPEVPFEEGDRDHLRVLLGQCHDSIDRFRKRAPRTGATLRLGYDLERMRDVLARLELLLACVDPRPEHAHEAHVELARTLVRARCEHHRIAPLVTRVSRLAAGEMVSHAGRTGEHYITRTRGEYARMWAAAAGAGLVVAGLAAIKVGLGALHAPPLVTAVLYSANYAIGFLVVQALGLTIATKQPAMTAAALASSIDTTAARDARPLADTIVRLVRSQLAAILGNVLLALPAAVALATVIEAALGHPFPGPEKAHRLIDEIDPLRSGAIPHAAITGVWLALSGLVAGSVSNTVIARHVPERIRASGPLRRALGERMLDRLARFVERSAGATAGSIALGVLLGSTGIVGAMWGLPIDIRHVSFASANAGLALASLGPEHVPIARTALGIAAIGATNLAVSFSLSLALALHARQRTLRELPGLARALARSVRDDALAWILPVGRTAAPAPDTDAQLAVR